MNFWVRCGFFFAEFIISQGNLPPNIHKKKLKYVNQMILFRIAKKKKHIKQKKESMDYNWPVSKSFLFFYTGTDIQCITVCVCCMQLPQKNNHTQKKRAIPLNQTRKWVSICVHYTLAMHKINFARNASIIKSDASNAETNGSVMLVECLPRFFFIYFGKQTQNDTKNLL